MLAESPDRPADNAKPAATGSLAPTEVAGTSVDLPPTPPSSARPPRDLMTRKTGPRRRGRGVGGGEGQSEATGRSER